MNSLDYWLHGQLSQRGLQREPDQAHAQAPWVREPRAVSSGAAVPSGAACPSGAAAGACPSGAAAAAWEWGRQLAYPASHWFTEAVGWASRRRVPRGLRRSLYGGFARFYNVDVAEAESPLEDYGTFGEFFARRLRPGARQFGDGSGDERTVVAPCDGQLAARGTAGGGRLIQAKGRDYSLAAFVGDMAVADTLEGGTYLTFYLSPRDYHRVHCPISGTLLGYDWIPGSLFPVSPRFLNGVDDVFSRNERVVFHFDTAAGPMVLAMVAATGVGNVRLADAAQAGDSDTRALRAAGKRVRFRYDEPLVLRLGDELGAFHLGSTVIVIFPPSRIELAGAAAFLPGPGIAPGTDRAAVDSVVIRAGDDVARCVEVNR